MHKQMYELPEAWEEAVIGWVRWLIAAGAPATTIRTRRGHVRGVARRLRTDAPRGTTVEQIVKVCSNEEWSPDHRRGLKTSLTQFFDWAVKSGLADDNPAFELPHVSESRPKPLPVNDRMWKQAITNADAREALAARLADEVGMRRGEVSICHTDDVLETFDGYELVVHGKGNKQRIVPITDELARDIMRGPGQHAEGYGRVGYLFPGRIDGHISADYIGKLIGDLLPPKWTMHKLRHRFATRMYVACGKDIMIVKELLGHESVKTTQRYLAISNHELRAAVNALAAVPVAA
ncbi:hypothetical protein CH300_20275 [Rhodococcus sp. 15-1154-1]|nr:tyrosine-type recombinase/integrase [Rhodococcus sp. 15-1154-1]OZF00615.1 hypothetical protein CH300_20275 [Rhodococcus sp. 15-1154-1]